MKTKMKNHRNHVHQAIVKLRKNPKTSATLQDALQTLNEAAQGKREELYQAMESHYRDIREACQDAFVNVAASGKNALQTTAKTAGKALHSGGARLEKGIRKTAGKVDKKVHENPWLAISSLSLGAFLLGYNMHRQPKAVNSARGRKQLPNLASSVRKAAKKTGKKSAK